MIKVCALASGSNGNCYYIGNREEAIIVDAGISKRQLFDRLNKTKLNKKTIKAIFISHEHRDHYKGARVISKSLNIPVYITSKTLKRSYKEIIPENVIVFNVGDIIDIGDFKVYSFAKKHDAADPCSFRVGVKNKNIGVFTDIGFVDDELKRQLKECDIAFLEANYDEKMLESGRYPTYLKQRVAGKYGHLSNKQAVGLLENNNDKLSTVVLSHISEDNNNEGIILNEFAHLNDKYNIEISSRYEPTKVFELF